MESHFHPFLTRVLNRTDYRLIQLAGDASARRYYRIAGGDRTWVLMVWEPFKANEYPFLSVHRHFQASHVFVPEVVSFSEEEGLVLLEDLGDLTLERKFWENQNPEMVIPYYEKALDELVKIHFLTLRNNINSTAVRTQFDTEKFIWEFNYCREHLLVQLCQLTLNPEQEEVLRATFTSISQRLHSEPKWISHRDYHSRNLMIKLDQVRVIDFQDARRGPLPYDLVSLLRDSYVQIPDDMAEGLVRTFKEKAKPYLPKDFSSEHFDLMYELQTVQRCFKACGSFSSFWNTRKDTRYLKYISSTLRRVLKSLYYFPEYRDFGNFLLDSGLLERKFE
ncbi:MAG: hypothetical protein C5B49_06175 [Bdellovibrio sp.]|nr:MAG: hypothetical protein C5B49_06175 [Bdellovibrio sp.]